MAVAIRLMRFGKKGFPTYRIVALDKRSKRDGAYIEKVGLYNPMAASDQFQVNEERLSYWIKNGAIISDGMKKLLTSRNPKVKKRITKKAKKPAVVVKKSTSPKKETPAQAPVEKKENVEEVPPDTTS
jgi:small subunit ribosomal protein S16